MLSEDFLMTSCTLWEAPACPRARLCGLGDLGRPVHFLHRAAAAHASISATKSVKRYVQNGFALLARLLAGWHVSLSVGLLAKFQASMSAKPLYL